MRQLQSCLVVVREQFKRDQRIARLSFVPPSVGDFLVRNHFGDFAKMVILHAFVLDDEFKFKPDLGFEFLQIEIPAPHFFDIGNRFPNPRDGRVESSLNNKRFRQIIFCSQFSRLLLKPRTRS